MFRTLKSPLDVQVEITEDCDNCCRHCYNAFRHKDCLIHTMSWGQIDFLLEEFSRWQLVRCVVTGGEPLLVPDIALHLARGAKALGLGVSINTNMTHFTQGFGENLLATGIKGIMSSLTADTPQLHDWITQNPGSFLQATENIQLAIEMGFRVIVNMVLTKWSFDRLERTGDLVGRLGAAKFGATRACSPSPIATDFHKNTLTLDQLRASLVTLYDLKDKWGYEIDVFEHYPWCAMQDLNKYEYLARRKCTAGVTSATIGADGQLRPCGHSPLIYGNVFSRGLKPPWKKMDDWRRQDYASQTCQKCNYFEKCGGGCPAETKSFGRDPHCTWETDVLPIVWPATLPHQTDGNSYVLADNVVLRQEEFGGIIASGDGGVSLLGEQTFQMISTLSEQSAFSTQAMVDEFSVKPEEANAFLSRLIHQNLIKEVTP